MLMESNEGQWGWRGGWRDEGVGVDALCFVGYDEKFGFILTALGSCGNLVRQTHYLFLMSYFEINIDSQKMANIVQSNFHLVFPRVTSYVTLISKPGI